MEPIKKTFTEGTQRKATAWLEKQGNLPGRQEAVVCLWVPMVVKPDECQTESFHFKDVHTSSSGNPVVTVPRVQAQVNCTRELADLSRSGRSKTCYILELTLLAPLFTQFQPALTQGQSWKHSDMISAFRVSRALGGRVSLCLPFHPCLAASFSQL